MSAIARCDAEVMQRLLVGQPEVPRAQRGAYDSKRRGDPGPDVAPRQSIVVQMPPLGLLV